MTKEKRPEMSAAPKDSPIDMWSRQMLEMQAMLLAPTRPPVTPVPKTRDEDLDDDMWDNLPV